MIAGLFASAAVTVLTWLPELAEDWDYFRRTPPPPIGWELAPLGVMLAPYVLALLGGSLICWRLESAVSFEQRGPEGSQFNTRSASTTGQLSLASRLRWSLRCRSSYRWPCLHSRPRPLQEPSPALRLPPGCFASSSGVAPFRGDPREIATRPEDLGPEWNAYTESLEELPNGDYSATYRLGNPATDGVLLSFKVRIFGDSNGAVADYCGNKLPPDALSLKIGDGLYFDPPTPIERTLETSGPRCPEDNGGVFLGGVGRARNVLLELGVRQQSGHAWSETNHAITAAQALVRRVSARW